MRNDLELYINLQPAPRNVEGMLPSNVMNQIFGLHPDLKVNVLPTYSREKSDPLSAGYSDFVAYLLYIGGAVGTFAVAKDFFSAMAKEAGKDAYGGIKKLCLRLFSASRDNSYRTIVKIYLFLPVWDDYIAVNIDPGMLEKGETTDEEIEARVDEILKSVSEYLNSREKMYEQTRMASEENRAVRRVDVFDAYLNEDGSYDVKFHGVSYPEFLEQLNIERGGFRP